MSYIGNKPSQTLASPTSQYFNGTGSQTVFTLNRLVNVSEDLEVFVNNIQQEPGVGKSYTATGSTLTFDAAPSAGTNNVYVVYRGLAEVTTRLETDPNSAISATTGTFSGDLTVDTNTLYVDSTNNRIGIGTSSPDFKAEIVGGTNNGLHIKDAESATVFGGLFTQSANLALVARSNHALTLGTNDTERMRIDASGKVGIGTASPSSYNGGADDLVLATTGATGITIASGTTSNGSLFFADGTSGADQYRGYVQYEQSNNAMAFGTSGTERMRIDASGRLLVNATVNNVAFSSARSQIRYSKTGEFGLHIRPYDNDTGGGQPVLFQNYAGGTIGSIGANASVTSYNTTSDYRLKTAVTYDWDATSRLKQLKPARFEWIADGDDAVPVDGFLAHEVQSVIPEAITGTKDEVDVWKDGEELPDGVSVGDNKLDENGNTIPVMQGIDQSKIVPLLVKTILELEARITALESE
jgi:hypothetical protein